MTCFDVVSLKIEYFLNNRPSFAFSVLTSYFKENVLYSEDDLWNKNESGISMLLYLRQIYPGTNFFISHLRKPFTHMAFDGLMHPNR